MQHGTIDLNKKHLNKYFSEGFNNKSIIYSSSSPNLKIITSFGGLQLPIGVGFFPKVRNSPTIQTPTENNLIHKVSPRGKYEWQGS